MAPPHWPRLDWYWRRRHNRSPPPTGSASTSTDWFTATNWSAGVPTSAVDTIIATVAPNATVVGAAGAQAHFLYVGAPGTGTLTIQNGGTVSDVLGSIGYGAGATGAATVDGAGSAWINSSDLYAGVFSGTGTLTIQNGGAVSNSDGFFGYSAGSTGAATVDGAGSSWNNFSEVFVGYFGTGTLTIQNGGTVSNGTAGYLGFSAGSTGTATVDGVGSAWSNYGFLVVGKSGTGTLTIQNGGVVNVADGVDVAIAAGSSGTLNIGAAVGQAAVAPGTLNTSLVAFGAGTGVIVFNHTALNHTFAPAVSGAGSVRVEAGTTILTAANTYTGATSVNAGTLQAGAQDAFAPASAFTVASGATLALNSFDQSIGSLAGAGHVTLGLATLTGGGNNASTIFSGVMSGNGGLAKIGTGVFALTGTNTYIGPTAVNGGTLAVNGSIASSSLTTVNSGGTLGGNGTVGNTAINGGALAPGNSIGLLTVQGSLTLTAASSYMVEVSPANADRTNVTATANLGGATVNASFRSRDLCGEAIHHPQRDRRPRRQHIRIGRQHQSAGKLSLPA